LFPGLLFIARILLISPFYIGQKNVDADKILKNLADLLRLLAEKSTTFLSHIGTLFGVFSPRRTVALLSIWTGLRASSARERSQSPILFRHSVCQFSV
jgi:hypothetical protein